MRILIFLIIGTVLLFSACDSKNSRLAKNKKSGIETGIPKIEEKPVQVTINQIKEVEEKLIANNNKLPNPHRYFVIIGSFRNPDNAKNIRDRY